VVIRIGFGLRIGLDLANLGLVLKDPLYKIRLAVPQYASRHCQSIQSIG
jgi:hypothetical protein